MAKINKLGNIVASCPGRNGSTSTFEYMYQGRQLGVTFSKVTKPYGRFGEEVAAQYRLFRCAGCGMGALGYIRMRSDEEDYPGGISELLWFMPESKQRLTLPDAVPIGIKNEFREAEKCLENGTIRAAAGMFRSVLDKTLRANGYKTNKGEKLAQQIDLASDDGIITVARKKRAHEEIRVLGNDVLHDEWHEIPIEDVEAARHYAQRILEDFYDTRDTVQEMLRAAKRVPDEDKEKPEEET